MPPQVAIRTSPENLQQICVVSNDIRALSTSFSEEVNARSSLGCQDLRQLRLFADLSDKGLHALSQSLTLVRFTAGQTIFQQNDEGHNMFVVFQGRVKVSSDTAQGGRVLRFLDRDEHFGEMSALTHSRRTANVIAVTDTQLLQIDSRDFDSLRKHEPSFEALISETLAVRLACSMHGFTKQSENRNIGILCGSACAEQLSKQLCNEMRKLGANIKFLKASDETIRPGSRNAAHRQKANNVLPSESELHRLGEQYDRVLLSMCYYEAEHQMDLISQCERIVCFVDSAKSNATERIIERLLASNPKLAPRIHCVRVIPEGARFADLVPATANLGRDFKVPLCANTPSNGESATLRGLRRIVRFLFDQRLGIALGGGGARGLAHLGVLRALDDEGIGIDLISGTSMGALIGLCYAAGWSPTEAESILLEELTPGRFFSFVPLGKTLFILSKFRLGGWESMLRRFFEHATFEQFQIPLSTVSADLLRGGQIIRESGDGVAAILESINLPYLSKPIVRDGCLLVDGGILNNVPIDLLRPRGATTVVGVDVCSHLPLGFVRKSAKHDEVAARHPSMLEMALRLNEIRRHHVSRANYRDADQMIWIDTSRFEFEDFSKAHQLAEVGYRTASEIMPRIRQLVDDRFAQSLKVG